MQTVLDAIHRELAQKQKIFPAKPANYLMTYAGIVGAVGGIAMSTEIPWDTSKLSHDKIPTEKAVGDYIFTICIDNGEPVFRTLSFPLRKSS